MRFSKWHALGNSYLLVERADLETRARSPRTRSACATRITGSARTACSRSSTSAAPRRTSSSGTRTGHARSSRATARASPRCGSRAGAASRSRASTSASGVVPARVEGDEVEVDLGPVHVGRPEALNVDGERHRGHAGLGRQPARGHPARAVARRAPPPRPAGRARTSASRSARTSSSSARTARTT